MNDDMLELSMWREGNIMHENCIEDMNKLKAERDEARRNLCYAEVNGQYARRYTPQEYAKLKGWDCFKNDTLSQEVSQEGSKLPATISSNGIRITEYIPPQNSVLEIHPYGAYTTGESTLSVPAIKETT